MIRAPSPVPDGARSSAWPVTAWAMSRPASRAAVSGTPFEVRVSTTRSVVTWVSTVEKTAMPTAAAKLRTVCVMPVTSP